MWQTGWGPENLLRTESGEGKVGFVVQKLHGSEILKMQNFALGARFRALSYIFPALPGAARYALASSYGMMWLVETIPCLYPRIVQAILFPAGGRSRILVEEKKLNVVIRFGS